MFLIGIEQFVSVHCFFLQFSKTGNIELLFCTTPSQITHPLRPVDAQTKVTYLETWRESTNLLLGILLLQSGNVFFVRLEYVRENIIANTCTILIIIIISPPPSRDAEWLTTKVQLDVNVLEEFGKFTIRGKQV